MCVCVLSMQMAVHWRNCYPTSHVTCRGQHVYVWRVTSLRESSIFIHVTLCTATSRLRYVRPSVCLSICLSRRLPHCLCATTFSSKVALTLRTCTYTDDRARTCCNGASWFLSVHSHWLQLRTCAHAQIEPVCMVLRDFAAISCSSTDDHA